METILSPNRTCGFQCNNKLYGDTLFLPTAVVTPTTYFIYNYYCTTIILYRVVVQDFYNTEFQINIKIIYSYKLNLMDF